MPELTIGVPVRNQLPFARACLESLARRRRPGTRILVVDDDSRADCSEYLEEFAIAMPATSLLRNSQRRGFPYNCNEILYNSSTPLICILNSDTIVAPGWEAFLVEALAANSECALAGPSTSFAHTAQCLSSLVASRMEQDETAVAAIGENVYRLYRGRYRLLPSLGGFCLLFTRDLVRRIGFFDERFGLGGGEEDDFIRRAKVAGFGAVWVMYAYVHHFGHCTFTDELGLASSALWTKNRLIYQIKKLSPEISPLIHPHSEGGPLGGH